MKKVFSIFMMLCCACIVSGQKIDFDISGKTGQALQEGFVEWVVPEGVSDTKDFDGGIQVTVSAAQGTNPMDAAHNDDEIRHVKTEWWKNGITSGNDGARILGDALIITGDDHSYVTSGATKLDVTIFGLKAGHHSLQAYHNCVEYEENQGAIPDIDIYVNGIKVKEGVKQSIRKSKFAEAGQSYVEFDVTEGQSVTVSYVSTPKEGISYGRTYVTVNAFVFNEVDNSKIALDPIPNSGEFHAGDGNGNVTLQWTSPASAVKHHVLLGNDADNLSDYVITTEPVCDVTGLDPLKKYYWRIDEEDASGNISQGEVWLFQPARLAFPGAEGYGRFAIGGRGGSVYHVTTLDDNGDDENPIEGSFRYGIKKVSGPRTIVFDVAGVISLKSRLTCSDKFVTIAGQTAPGNGVMLRTCPFGMQSDGITRFLRMRLGHKKMINGLIPKGGDNGNGVEYAPEEAGQTEETTLSGLDGMGMSGNDHAIMDHCSISWTIDEAFSSRSAKAITLQHTLISEALNIAGHPNYSSGTGHGYAATIGAGQNSGQPGSFHHNLLAHCEGRNWSISGGLDGGGSYDGHHDIFNNVVYNWGHRASDGGTHELNFVNNYYKKGSATSQNYLLRHQFEGTGSGTQRAYVSGNIREETSGSKTKDALNNTYKYETSGGQVLNWEPWSNEPFFPSYANIETAEAAYKNVLSDVGCTQPFFDNHDQRMVNETLNRSYSTKGVRSKKNGIIDTEEDTGCEGFDLEKLGIVNATRANDWDSDADGIPNWFEELTGTNASVANNNDDRDGDFYTDLEEYLNWIAVPNFIVEGSQEITLKNYFAGYVSPTYEVTSAAGVVAQVQNGKLNVTPSETAAKLFSIVVKATEGSISLEREFHFAYSNGTSGIQTITKKDIQGRELFYDLFGRKMSKPVKGGVYIQNGKKFIVK
jgi:hypothetical protein